MTWLATNMNLSITDIRKMGRVAGFAADPTMDQSLVRRYQPGGDLYTTLATTQGTAAANSVASAAATGQRESVTNAMANIRNTQATGSTSTFTNFMQQITSDPLQAPIAAAMGQGSSGPGLGGNTTGKVLGGLATIAVIGLVLYGVSTYAKLKGKG